MEKKPWYTSMTLWSVAITALGVFAPKYAPVISGVVGDVATIAGLVGSVIGRLRATQQVSFTAKQE
jgi:hypothetical protein